jgi:hypothetical protein
MEKYRLIAVVAAIFIAIFADFFFPFLVPQVKLTFILILLFLDEC